MLLMFKYILRISVCIHYIYQSKCKSKKPRRKLVTTFSQLNQTHTNLNVNWNQMSYYLQISRMDGDKERERKRERE